MKEDNTQYYYNDEWNIVENKEEFKWIDFKQFQYELLFQGKIKLSEYLERIQSKKEFNSKNDKPDGRRYKK